MVERNLAKVEVAGPNPVFRSRLYSSTPNVGLFLLSLLLLGHIRNVNMIAKRIIRLGVLLLGLVALASCGKDPAITPNPILGSWELDYTQFRGPNGELYEQRWDHRQVVTFKEATGTVEYIFPDNTSTVSFGYYLQNGTLYYNNVYVELSYNGESAQILNLEGNEMRILFRGENTPWEETINRGKPDEKTVNVVSEVDIYKRK